jgi:hypothetical protein
MKRPSNVPGTGSTISQGGPGHRRSSSARPSGFYILGVCFFCFVLLTLLLCMATSEGKAYMDILHTSLSTEDRTLMFFAHLTGFFATIVLFGVLAGVAALLHFYMKGSSRYDRVLATLRLTLRHDPNARVRARAAEALGELDVEESALHEEHEELDDLLISTLQGEQRDPSPDVRAKAIKGLGNLELEQHSYHHEHNQLDDFLFEENL